MTERLQYNFKGGIRCRLIGDDSKTGARIEFCRESRSDGGVV